MTLSLIHFGIHLARPLFFQVWGEMVRGKKPPEDRPELLLSLNYLPQAERLTVVIMKAKNLGTVHDVYIKVSITSGMHSAGLDAKLKNDRISHLQMHLIVNGKRVKKKKTSVRKYNGNVEPTWNEAFTFNLSQSNMPHAAIEVTHNKNEIIRVADLNFLLSRLAGWLATDLHGFNWRRVQGYRKLWHWPARAWPRTTALARHDAHRTQTFVHVALLEIRGDTHRIEHALN